MTTSLPIDDYKLQQSVRDLHRLLHCMECGDDCYLTSQSVIMRAEMAQELWLQMNQFHSTDSPHITSNLQERVDQACRKARSVANAKKEHETDWVEKIFFPQKEPPPLLLEERLTTPETLKEQPERTIFTAMSPTNQPLLSEQSVQEIQAAQRDQLEEEISFMASQLKESTARMNLSLKTQTQELDEMGLLAEENVQQVGQAATDVASHLKRSWGSTIATWTMIATVFGTFLFAMVTMRMIPKRKNLSIPFLGEKPLLPTTTTTTATTAKLHDQPWEAPCLLYCNQIPKTFGMELEEACLALSAFMGHTFLCPVQNQIDKLKELNYETVYNKYEEMNQHRIVAQDTINKEQQQAAIGKQHTNVCLDDVCDAIPWIADPGALLLVHNNDELNKDDSALHKLQQNELTGDNSDREVREKSIDEESTLISDAATGTSMDHVNIDGVAILPDITTVIDATFSVSQSDVQEKQDHDESADTEHKDETDQHRRIISRAAVFCNLDMFQQHAHARPELVLQQDENGWTSFTESVAAGCVDVVEFILETLPDFDVNQRTFNGATPLWWASQKGVDRDHAVFTLLEPRGGTIDGPRERKDEIVEEHLKPLVNDEETASRSDHTVDISLSRNILLAAFNGNTELLAHYVESSPHLLEVTDKNGWRPIHEAVKSNKISTVRFLLNKGVDFNARTGLNNKGQSPLTIANSWLGETSEISTLLRSKGAREFLSSEDSSED